MAGWGFSKWGFGPRSAQKQFDKFAFGSPEKRENVSTLRPEQEPLYQQAIQAGLGEGAGGAFGQSADYYRGLLNDQGYNDFAAPALRQYNEDIVPGISEQFAGFGGSGSLSGSGFRNAQVQGATDLGERLAQIRANLRQQGAQGLQNIGQAGLGNFSQNMVTQPGSPGLLRSVAPAIGTAAGAALGGPAGAAAGNAAGSWLSNSLSGNRSGSNPYQGGGGVSSPQSSYRGSFGSLPNFGG